MNYESSEPEFVGRIPKREPLFCTPSFKCIYWDAGTTKLATVHLNNVVEFHSTIPRYLLPVLVRHSVGKGQIQHSDSIRGKP